MQYLHTLIIDPATQNIFTQLINLFCLFLSTQFTLPEQLLLRNTDDVPAHSCGDVAQHWPGRTARHGTGRGHGRESMLVGPLLYTLHYYNE